MIREFVNNLYVPNNNWHVVDPYFHVRIDSIDNMDIIVEKFTAFAASDVTEMKGDWIGLKRSDSSSNITFTKTFDLPKTGKYLIEVLGYKRPQATGSMTVDVDGTTVLTENMHNDWEDYGTWIRCPIMDITDDGSCTIAVTVPKHAFVGKIRIVPITRYEGGKEYSGPSETRLDIIDIEFTTNGVNEVDKATVKIAMKEDFYTDDNPYSTLCFDAWDHATIVLGEDMLHAIPMFGGYVSGWEINEEQTVLTLHLIDRIYDLSRVYVWKNFSIGYIPSDTTGSMPFTQFPNVNEIARYLCSSDFPINFDAITRDYIFYNNFATSAGVSSLTNTGWIVDWQPEFGNPAPCMRLRPKALGESSLVLYSDTLGVWDATVHNYFNFDYYVSGAGVLFPPKFNIEIDMFKDEQTPSLASTYIIPFSGPSTTTNASKKVLDPVLPKFDGTWNSFLVDLKKLFNKSSGASTHYYIKEIRLVGVPDEQQLLNNRCTSIYIDHIMAYRDFQSAPRYASADSKTPLNELQDMCEKCNQVAYVRPGMERRDDQLIMIPKRFYTLPIAVTEGDNLIDVSQVQYKPIDWGMENYARRTFNYDDSRSGSVTAQENMAEKWYNTIISNDFLGDVKTEQDARTDAQYHINEHAFNYPAFDVTVRGTTLMEPGQYMFVDIPSKRITGTQEVKSIKFNLNCVEGYFTTTISFNQPHRHFMTIMRQTLKTQKELRNIVNNSNMRSYGNQDAALNTSSGAYVKY